MYNNYFGFSESPFNIAPNSRFFYRTPSCDDVLETVHHAITARKGILAVIGEPGTGKTLLLKSFVRDLSPQVTAVVVQNPHIDFDGLLDLLMDRLGLRGAAINSAAKFDRLAKHLLEQSRKGRAACLFIDEAQDLPAATLDALRLLANLELENAALLPIVLLGQPELNVKLDHPSAARIKQRVALTRHMYPLIRKEVGPYIAARLKVAGCEKADLFDAGAIEKIAAYSAGIPRMVNAICDNSLLRACRAQLSVVSAQLVDQVARELRLVPPLSLSQAGFDANGASEAIPDAHAVTDQVDKHVVEPDAAGAQEGGPTAEAQSPQPETARQVETTKVTPASGHINLDRDFPAPPKSNSDDHTRTRLRSGPPRRRLRWYAIVAVIGLLLLALNTVYSSELANIYSTLWTANRRLVANIQSMELWPRQELNGAGFEPAPANPAAAKSPVINPGPPELPSPEPSARPENDAFPGAMGKNFAPVSSSPPPIDARREAQADAAPIKKPESKPRAVIFDVVGLSSVRAKPSAQADIIAELEPGRRIKILSQSREYYQVQSLDDASIRGYVHREDAAFEQRNPSQSPTSR